eukprot:CAMPEP_0197453410 /NCGR_PEP_ID=MMETSP1175-20131217/34854_1 /TAXON_ID=1003142 /ORGANISM="Triceratium dubium, Strain CCMP147" /LENGTH=115 /DNA_ID=CAMNT_0042986691 /DNA_START=30 /DNA_END=373 /DNA_ORIENTATION=+
MFVQTLSSSVSRVAVKASRSLAGRVSTVRVSDTKRNPVPFCSNRSLFSSLRDNGDEEHFGDGDQTPCSTNTEEPSSAESAGMETLSESRTRDSLPVTFADISRANVAIRSGVVRT